MLAEKLVTPCFVQPKQARSRRTVGRIVAAAYKMIKSRGYENLSMGALADKAGIGLGSLYNRFPSKERLLIFLADEIVVEKLRSEQHPMVTPRVIKAASLEKFLKIYCGAVAEIFVRYKSIIRPVVLVGRSSSDAELLTYLAHVNDEVHADLGAVLCKHLGLDDEARSDLPIRFVVSWLGSVLRERYLFGALNDVRDDKFIGELVAAVSAYLTSASSTKGVRS